MNFLKKHYEKILLGVVLAGLLAVLVFMLFYIAADKQDMEQNAESLINNPTVKPLPDLNLTTNDAVISRLGTPFTLDFETQSKVFNPFEWQRTLDGQMVKKASLGAQQAVVTRIVPLRMILTLDSVLTNEFGVRYVIGVTRQASKIFSQRVPQQRYVSMGDKANDAFELVGVKGPPASPTELMLKLVDSGDVIALTPGKPFMRVDDYMADFNYPPEKKVFRSRRTGDKVSFGGSNYDIVGISKNEVILSDQSNQKKTSLPFNP